MTTIDLFLFLTSYTFVVAAAALWELLRDRAARFLITVVVTLVALIATTAAGFYLDEETSYFGLLRYLISERDLSSVAALTMGVAAGSLWVVRNSPRGELDKRSAWYWLEPVLLATSVGTVVLCGQAFIWKEILGVTRHSVQVYADEFVIDKVADLDDAPLRIAASDEGTVYICYDYFKKHGAIGGAILQLTQDSGSDQFHKRIVAESPFLVRPYGLAVRDGDLFVSRSGFFPKTSLGTVTYESTGAITQLKDTDNDGYFEYADDVVSGLPGVRGPDTMQQNNGIVFAPDGRLFITSAGAADRTLDEHPWGGTVLCVSPDFRQTEVFARGFRNPFTIALGPDDEVFVTDSDVDQNPGDELNHVIRGAHFGHPFVIPNETGVEPSGFRNPVFVGERETVFGGMVYATSSSLPEPFRNCLYVTDFRQNRLLRMKLARNGDTYKVTGVHVFASVPSPVDLTVTPAGEFFVISRRAAKVFRIRLRKTGENGNHA